MITLGVLLLPKRLHTARVIRRDVYSVFRKRLNSIFPGPVRCFRFRLAFTIVELLVVLVIVSLLSATALVMVRLPLRNAEIELAFEQIRSIDSLARGQSGKGRPVTLRVLPAEKRLILSSQSGNLISLLNLPQHASISRVFVLNQEKSDSLVELHYTNQTSPTFAVMLGKTSGLQSWLLFCGLSGESYRFDKEEGNRVIAGLVAQKRSLAD